MIPYNKTVQWWQQPFFQVALPIIIAFAIATLFQSRRIGDLGKRLDDMGKRIDDLRDSLNRRLDAIEVRLSRIEELLFDHDRRIMLLEERTSPLRP
jgi:hypothetical protein